MFTHGIVAVVAGTRRVLAVVLLLVTAGCFTTARRDARVTPGGEVGLAFSGFVMPRGTDEDGMKTDARGSAQVELDLQYGTVYESGAAVALQLRLPINLYLATLDAFVQLPPLADGLYVGVGAELSVMPGGYALISKYFGDTYLSFTQRVLLRDPYRDGHEFEVTLNPQVSLGHRGRDSDLSVFAGYYQMLGDGFNVQVDLCDHSCVDVPGDDYHKRVVLVGGALRY